MKKIMIACVVAALVPAAAMASGPGGSGEGAARTKTYNNVRCAKGTNVGGLLLYAGSNGIEACNDGRAKQVPQGRVIATNAQGGYIAVDGDKDNKPAGPVDARNYARIDSKGAHCGKSGSVQDSTSRSQPAKNKCP